MRYRQLAWLSVRAQGTQDKAPDPARSARTQMEADAMPNLDRYCVSCGMGGSYLDFSPSYGEPATQQCTRHPEDGCGSTVAWLEDDDDSSARLARSSQGTQSTT